MKKVLGILLVALSISATSVSAMTKEELQDKLTKSYTINGVEWKISQSDIAQVERYLNENEVSSSDADYIASKIDEVIALIENGSATSIKDLTKSEKNAILAIINDISEKTSVKITIENGNIVIYNQNGSIFTTITTLVKQTGNSHLLFLGSSLISICGMFALARKVKKENA